MKTIICALFMSLFCFAFSAQAQAAPAQTPQTQKLGRGQVAVYDFGRFKLHAFMTGDPLADICFILEGEKNLAAIESPSFKGDDKVWTDYAAELKKPLSAVFVAYHSDGGKWYGQAKVVSTEAAQKAMFEGDAKAVAASLAQTFGPDFLAEMAKADELVKNGPATVGGLRFEVVEMPGGYDLVLSEINAVYTHMLGADTHSIMASPEHIESMIESLEGYQRKGYALILSSHHAPETQADVATKIAYLQKASVLAEASKSGEDFIAAMKTAFPGYLGENYLEMSAGFLFAK